MAEGDIIKKLASISRHIEAIGHALDSDIIWPFAIFNTIKIAASYMLLVEK